MTVAHQNKATKRASGRNDEHVVAGHKQTLFFVVMDALVNVLVNDVLIQFTAMRPVTAMSQPCALHLSCPNQLTANRYTHAFGMSSILVRQKMKMK